MRDFLVIPTLFDVNEYCPGLDEEVCKREEDEVTLDPNLANPSPHDSTSSPSQSPPPSTQCDPSLHEPTGSLSPSLPDDLLRQNQDNDKKLREARARRRAAEQERQWRKEQDILAQARKGKGARNDMPDAGSSSNDSMIVDPPVNTGLKLRIPRRPANSEKAEEPDPAFPVGLVSDLKMECLWAIAEGAFRWGSEPAALEVGVSVVVRHLNFALGNTN